MSNVKQVHISGNMPFNTNESDSMLKLLGQLNSPTTGIKIKWSDRPLFYIDNLNSGKTAYYGFLITGEDSVSEKWIANALIVLTAFKVELIHAWYCDIENNLKFFNLYEDGCFTRHFVEII